MSTTDSFQKLKKEFDDFAYIVSHDLRAPLRAISNLSDWIQDDLGDKASEEVMTNFQLLKERTMKLDAMIVALLDYSRINRMNMEIEKVNTAQLVEELRKNMDANNHVKWTINGMPELETYRFKITTVLRNLMKNAVEHNSNPQPAVTISCKDEGELYVFTIDDNGPGIPEDKRELALTMFRSLHQGDKQKSTGSGLTIARKTVAFAGGDLSLDNSPDGGTRVQFSWPKNLNQSSNL
jgi:light-regulated signal transduction histidine kinase (bacteriophytochrome)